jgi:beta-phosphoglucomutase-like phosphatase (HAD superfamily)
VATANDVQAVVFDLDGVLVDSEPLWDEIRRAVVASLDDLTQALVASLVPQA